jgi:hypothetical protein
MPSTTISTANAVSDARAIACGNRFTAGTNACANAHANRFTACSDASTNAHANRITAGTNAITNAFPHPAAAYAYAFPHSCAHAADDDACAGHASTAYACAHPCPHHEITNTSANTGYVNDDTCADDAQATHSLANNANHDHHHHCPYCYAGTWYTFVFFNIDLCDAACQSAVLHFDFDDDVSTRRNADTRNSHSCAFDYSCS